MKTLTVNDLNVAYLDERPSGSDGADKGAVLLAHCASASSKEWDSLVPLLVQEGYRVLAPDFCGYGRSDPWPDNHPFDSDSDVHILLALADLVEGPVHLVGHSHGGVLALEAARQMGDRVRSLTLIEPTMFQLLREAGHRQWSVVAKMAVKVVKAVESGDSRKAAYIFTSFWIGRVKWFLLSERHKRAIAKTMKKVVLEFGIIEQAPRIPDGFATVSAPVQLIIGTRTRAPAKVVGQMLAEVLPHVELMRIKAGHMSPFTHKEQINQRVLHHLKQCI